MYHAKFWPSCLFETCKQNNNIYSWQLDVFPNGSVLTVCLKEHLSLPADHDCVSITCYTQTTGKFSAGRDPRGERKLFGFYLLQLLAGSGSQRAWAWLWERKLTHLFPGFSRSRSLRTDLPSTSGGGSSPAMSRIVGARSMFRTICGTLQRHRWLCRRANGSGGWHVGCFLHTMTHWPAVSLPFTWPPREGSCLWPQLSGQQRRHGERLTDCLRGHWRDAQIPELWPHWHTNRGLIMVFVRVSTFF